jgi:hypothetical protein
MLSRWASRALHRHFERKSLKIVPAHSLNIPYPRRSDDDVRRAFDFLCPVKTEHELIRMGGAADGGYLVPDDLEGIAACFSPGVSNNSMFERMCLDRGMRVHLADASVDGPGQGLTLNECTFEPAFLAAASSEHRLTSLEDWVNRHEPGDNDLLLQMDIESAEYASLLATPRAILDRFRIIVVEFHHLYLAHGELIGQMMEGVWARLAQNHQCIHLHINNAVNLARPNSGGMPLPKVIEATFIRRNRIQDPLRGINALPHPLDADCVPSKPPLELPAHLYRNARGLKLAQRLQQQATIA